MPPLKIAFLGTGGIAAKHSRYMRDCPDTQIVAGCDVNEQIVDGLWERTFDEGDDHPRPPAYTDAIQMYRDHSPDAVVICSPHTLHFEHASQALDNGCHILLEKPMVTDADDAYRLKDKVKKAGKLLIIGYNTPCMPEFFYLRQCIREGTFGKLELISGFLSQSWREPTSGSWRQDPKLSGGGQAYDSGAHILNSLTWSVESPVAEVQAFIDNIDTPVDINSAMIIRFQNGALASLSIGGNCPPNGSDLHYLFDNGRVDVDGWNGEWINVYQSNELLKYPPITAEMSAGSPSQNFIDAIQGRAEPRTTPENGIIHSELMDAIYESARTGKPARPKRNG